MDLAQALAEARRALHLLMTGRSVVKLVIDGQETTFNAVNRADLERYIASLEAALNGQPRRGAVVVVF